LIVGAETGNGLRHELTPDGCDVLGRLVAARRARLTELFADWSPAKQQELLATLRRLVTEIVPEVEKPQPDVAS
jgi:DNA-binding MarR family transcriptional regulator